MKTWQKIIFFFILIVFIYLRLTPIINKTVPYTYDQGRDFLKAAEIVKDKNITFIGPTTGIMGVFHGAWWYYLLTVPYIIFQGWPVGFYLFMFSISLAANLLFFKYLKDKFGLLTALFFISVVTASPYFISISFFVSNNIIVPYLILALIVLTFRVFEKRSNQITFLLIGLLLSFIFEFEVAFGLFLIPVFIISSLIFKEFRKKLLTFKNVAFFGIGLTVPILPRFLFEIKNGFIQTKTLFGFLNKPQLYDPKPLKIVFSDRLNLFWNYFQSISYDHNYWLSLGLFIIVTASLIIFRKKLKEFTIYRFFLVIIIFLFSISLLYKDNFWANYYEGIQYVFLILMIVSYYLISKYRKSVAYLILIIFFTIDIFAFYKDFNQSKIEILGLKEAINSIDFVKNKVGKNDYCLRIYTPPVIPYTYNYIIDYYRRQGLLSSTKPDFVDNKCIYIIEKDPYEFRVKKWREENMPKKGKLQENKKISNNVNIEIWESK